MDRAGTIDRARDAESRATPRRARALERIALAAPLAGLAASAVLLLAWNDVLPGGWRLRNAIEPDRVRAERETLLHALARLRAFEREDVSSAPGAIVFVGSSTIERFPLEESFPGRPVVDRGIANASAELLARCAAGLVPPARPAGFVVYAGAVDWRASGRDAARALGAIANLLDALRARAPDAPILLLGPLPERSMSARAVEDLRALDGSLRAATSAPVRGFTGVDVLPLARPPVSSAAGSLADHVSADALHLDRDGYASLVRLVESEGGAVGRLLAAPRDGAPTRPASPLYDGTRDR